MTLTDLENRFDGPIPQQYLRPAQDFSRYFQRRLDECETELKTETCPTRRKYLADMAKYYRAALTMGE